MQFLKLLFLSSFLLLSAQGWAATPALDDINQQDLDNINKEFFMNFTHTTVSSAASLGKIFGLDVGLVAGVTSTPKLKQLVLEIDPSTKVDMIPYAALSGSFSVPLGFTGEINLLPELKVSDVTIKDISFALKWTFTDLWKDKIPLDMAIKGHYSASELSFKQSINNTSTVNTSVDATIVFDNDIMGMDLVLSKKLFIFEPFLGLGMLKGESDTKVEAVGTATIFNTTLTASSQQSAASEESSFHFYLGAEMHLLAFNLSAEYANAFDTHRYALKLSLQF